ncbi:MAG: RibD family protein, partial [Mangrovibacterium sp.]|nr:RibD family protein [Mangrovibacterium sp.]
GILEKECMELNRRFFTFHQQKRPYVILKWAQTLDGFLDVDRSCPEMSGKPTWISNALSRRVVHRQRTEEAAILVGTNTVLKDNPSLTVREWSGRQPVRLVLDRQNRLPEGLHVKDGKAPTVIFTAQPVPSRPNLEFVRLDFQDDVIDQIRQYLYNAGLQSVVVEGGQQLLQSFIDRNAWDEAYVYVGKCWFGKGVRAPHLDCQPRQTEMLHDTQLLCFYRSR